MSIDTYDPRVRKARIGWWWRVTRYQGYPVGGVDVGGWRPTEKLARRASEGRVERAKRRHERDTW